MSLVELSLKFSAEVKDEGLLLKAAEASGAAIEAAVTWIEDDDRLGKRGGRRINR